VIVTPDAPAVGVCDSVTVLDVNERMFVSIGMPAPLTRIPSSKPTTEATDVRTGDVSLTVAVVVNHPAPMVTVWLRLFAVMAVQFCHASSVNREDCVATPAAIFPAEFICPISEAHGAGVTPSAPRLF
jgi:hypothetical protein